jgi:two-component system NtrC family sensor kinase
MLSIKAIVAGASQWAHSASRGRKLMLSITAIVVIVAAVSGLVNIRTEEGQLLNTMTVGADQLSKAITSATWHAMLDDHREAAYEVMQTIAEKQGIDRIRMFNRTGQVRFSTDGNDRQTTLDQSSPTCAICHAPGSPRLHVPLPSRRRIFNGADGRRRLEMVTPIYNEKSCSEAKCHAHPAEMKVLGVLDLSLKLDSVDQEVANMKARVLLVTAVEITLIGVFIIFFTRRFLTHPIAKLVEGFKAVSLMDLDKPLVIDGRSEELEELARSFNVMRDRLRAALAEINQFTQHLESKVAERTQQLQAAQKKLLQNDRLASLGQLSASVAHEINNPISGVLNLSMLMQRMLKDGAVPPNRLEEFRKYLGQVTNETARVGRIVSDLLAFSRRGKPQRAPADLNKVVKMTLSLAQHKMKLSNVTVEANLAESLPPVLCDASQIQQVALNLALNAAEATHGKSERRVEVSTAKGDGGVVLTVSDNGDGIPPENLSKIFDPFFTTKPEGKGVGLGLAVTYGIIQAHGGEIEVKSAVGEGTTFTVWLPVEQPARTAEAPLLELARDG